MQITSIFLCVIVTMAQLSPVFADTELSNLSAKDDQIEEITLTRAIEIAIDSATQIQKIKNDGEITGSQLMQAYGQFLPNLTLSGGLNQTLGNTYVTAAAPTKVDTNDFGGSLQLSSAINLFNGHADESSLKSLVERKSANELTLKRAKQQIALDVTQIFLQAIFDSHLIEISEANLKLSIERQKLLREQANVGVKDQGDEFLQEALTSQDESFRLSAINKVQSDELSLIKRLRLDARKKIHLIEPKVDAQNRSGEPKSLDELIQTAIANRADLQASDHSLRAAKFDVRAAHAGLLPKFDFGIAATSVGRNFTTHSVNGVNTVPNPQRSLVDQFGDQVNYSLGITFVWNIFDRSLTRTNEQKANISVRNLSIDNEDLRNSIVIEARQAYGDYLIAKSQLETNERGVTAAQRAYRELKARYDVGLINFVNLVEAQTALLKAETARAQAFFSCELQRRALATTAGTWPVP